MKIYIVLFQYHDKKHSLHVDGYKDVRTILSRHECPVTYDDDYFDNDLKDDPNIQAQQPDYGVYRGDIPSVSSLDDGNITHFAQIQGWPLKLTIKF